MKKKKRTVLFTGAGASKAFGYPITSGIFPKIAEMLTAGELFEDWRVGAQYRKAIHRYLRELMPGYQRRRVKNVSITALLSFVDYSILSGLSPSPGMRLDDLREFRQLVDLAMHEVLWWPRSHLHPLVKRLVDWFFRQPNKGHHVSLISTNYDWEIDHEIFRRYDVSYSKVARNVDFGFSWRAPFSGGNGRPYMRPAGAPHDIFKLHGSLNWAHCGLCNHVYVNLRQSPVYQMFGEHQTKNEANSCHCDHWPLGHLLVAPSIVRDVRDPNLLGIWHAAFEALRWAEEWIMVGYSLPMEDVAIRSMLFRAYSSRLRDNPIRVRVFQKKGRETEMNYRLLFPDCEYHNSGMNGCVKALEKSD